MSGDRLKQPRISPALLGWFQWYAARYVRRRMHALRLSTASKPDDFAGSRLIVVLNHPSWWDPLVALLLAKHVFPRREHYAPIEAMALSKYRFFGRLGFFGIDAGTPSGAAAFLRTGEAVLARPGGTLWVTAQGSFSDVRCRPLSLRSGTGHLVRRLHRSVVLPLALEYTFWEESRPEALARFGEPLFIRNGGQELPVHWTREIEARLEEAQNLLAADAMARRRDAFEVVLGGSAGVGGLYDRWRAARARLRGERFTSAHGTEGF